MATQAEGQTATTTSAIIRITALEVAHNAISKEPNGTETISTGQARMTRPKPGPVSFVSVSNQSQAGPGSRVRHVGSDCHLWIASKLEDILEWLVASEFPRVELSGTSTERWPFLGDTEDKAHHDTRGRSMFIDDGGIHCFER